MDSSGTTGFVELKKMTEVLDFIQKTPWSTSGRRIIAYDVDNTILKSAQLVGNDHWYRQHVAREEKETAGFVMPA